MNALARILDALTGLEEAAATLGWRSLLPEFLYIRRRLEQEPRDGVALLIDIYGLPLDEVFKPRESVGYLEPGPLQQAGFAFASKKFDLYRAAIDLWLQQTSGSEPELAGAADEIVRRNGRYFVRYDCGSHVPVWREDEITKDQARQAMLGPMHLSNMILALQNDLTAKGVEWSVENYKREFN